MAIERQSTAGSRSEYARGLAKISFQSTFDHLRREGVLLTIVVSLATLGISSIARGRFTARLTELLITLVALLGAALVLLVWNAFCAPYRMAPLVPLTGSTFFGDRTNFSLDHDRKRPVAIVEELAETVVRYRHVFARDIPLENGVVRNKRFLDCVIEGPVIFYGLSVSYSHVCFDHGNDIDGLLWPGRIHGSLGQFNWKTCNSKEEVSSTAALLARQTRWKQCVPSFLEILGTCKENPEPTWLAACSLPVRQLVSGCRPVNG